jgi:hypothetical protein
VFQAAAEDRTAQYGENRDRAVFDRLVAGDLAG